VAARTLGVGAESSDRELIGRLGDDPDAFELLYRRHVRRITTYVATRSSRPDEVVDLVAATFVAAFESRAAYDPARGEVVAWLIGIARHLSADQLRRALRERDALAQVAGHRALARDEIADLEARVDAVREAAELSGLLARLRARPRTAVADRGRRT
jgi:DNA-directed RNA polymerase specialized sigma24 family protein